MFWLCDFQVVGRETSAKRSRTNELDHGCAWVSEFQFCSIDTLTLRRRSYAWKMTAAYLDRDRGAKTCPRGALQTRQCNLTTLLPCDAHQAVMYQHATRQYILRNKIRPAHRLSLQ